MASPAAPPVSTPRVIRVFVSSTFRDMVEELVLRDMTGVIDQPTPFDTMADLAESTSWHISPRGIDSREECFPPS